MRVLCVLWPAVGINPEVTLVDLTHDVPPHDISAAAHELASTYRYFPAGTIFLVVIDPGGNQAFGGGFGGVICK